MYLCKIASLEEMNRKWDYEIEHNINDARNWIIWKSHFLENFKNDYIIPYYGILDGNIICEATAMLNSEAVQNSEGLVGNGVVYLSAFRTIEEYQGKGYFSKLMKFMLNDLKRRGIVRVTLGVEPAEETNKKIYAHYGFNEYIKSATEIYPDGTVIDVDYYGKNL
ncbi:MAG: GNAT family N-acetyltransferase [Lachnospiraceae bacterium]|jgi:GNAT superfamily N-acetyltransferase